MLPSSSSSTDRPVQVAVPTCGIVANTPKVYTRTGDDGTTGLIGGERVPKDDDRIEAYGTVDELNAVVGLCRSETIEAGVVGIDDELARVQDLLFSLGAELATAGDHEPSRDWDREAAWLEGRIDEAEQVLAPLRNFVLPGGSTANACLHLARTVCRRAERRTVHLQRNGGCSVEVVHFLNRLSDALFVWSRWVAYELGQADVTWNG